MFYTILKIKYANETFVISVALQVWFKNRRAKVKNALPRQSDTSDKNIRKPITSLVKPSTSIAGSNADNIEPMFAIDPALTISAVDASSKDVAAKAGEVTSQSSCMFGGAAPSHKWQLLQQLHMDRCLRMLIAHHHRTIKICISQIQIASGHRHTISRIQMVPIIRQTRIIIIMTTRIKSTTTI